MEQPENAAAPAAPARVVAFPLDTALVWLDLIAETPKGKLFSSHPDETRHLIASYIETRKQFARLSAEMQTAREIIRNAEDMNGMLVRLVQAMKADLPEGWLPPEQRPVEGLDAQKIVDIVQNDSGFAEALIDGTGKVIDTDHCTCVEPIEPCCRRATMPLDVAPAPATAATLPEVAKDSAAEDLF